MSATISAQFAFTLKRPHITRPFAVGVQPCEAIAAVFAEGGVYHWPDMVVFFVAVVFVAPHDLRGCVSCRSH
jgi:hypothetical protein